MIQYAQHGDVSAFEQLVYRYDKQVFAIAARFGNYADDAKDIYQEVFLRVFRGIKTFQQKSEFATWLYRITTNVCLTHQTQRKKYRYSSLNHDDDPKQELIDPALHERPHESSPEQHTLASDISFHIEAALRSLSPQQKLVFTLRHYQGYKLKEIATMMGCAEGTIKRYLFSATQRMREQLKDIYEA
ncbi:MAG: RNA polymerase sigma factor [Ignavibacteria bacterium]|nr:RNA polymerase sigma factor [Ignavibacteria bacterium]